MTASVGDIAKAVSEGRNAASPRFWRQISSAATPSTTWTRLDLATSLLNEFPVVTDLGTRLVDWDGTNKLLTFNDQTGANRDYNVFITTEIVTTGVTVNILPPTTLQLRFVVPDGGGVGVNYYFPNHGATSTNEYMDFSDIIANSTIVHQQAVACPAGAIARLHGIGIEARLSAAPPPLAAVSLASLIFYLIAN